MFHVSIVFEILKIDIADYTNKSGLNSLIKMIKILAMLIKLDP
jgi:hypothetical protein